MKKHNAEDIYVVIEEKPIKNSTSTNARIASEFGYQVGNGADLLMEAQETKLLNPNKYYWLKVIKLSEWVNPYGIKDMLGRINNGN